MVKKEYYLIQIELYLRVYLLKNVVEVVFAMFVFTPLNLFYGIHSGLKNDEGLCR